MKRNGLGHCIPRTRILLFIVAAALVLAVLAAPALAAAKPKPQAPSAPPAAKAWTVMVYIDGDNNLEEYVVKDIESELSALGSNADVNVVCIADRGPGYDKSRGDWQGTLLYSCTPGMLADVPSAVANWGERDMGDPQTLKDFVTWTKTNYPASHYLLAFWDHGYCWYPAYYTIRDETSAGDSLDDDEQVAAMQVVGGVDVVAWDACQRQMIEVAADWRPFALAMAGSEDYTNWEGIQYDKVIADLRATPAMTAQQVSDDIAKTALGDSVTFSSVALDARFTSLLGAVDQWAIALKNGLPAYTSAYQSAWRNTLGFTDAQEKDLYDAAYQIKAKVADATIKAKCDAVMSACQSAVTYNWTNGSRTYRNAHGLAIWWPKSAQYLNPSWTVPDDWAYYRTKEALAALTSWDEFLAAYCQ